MIKIFSDGFKVSRKRERFKITLENKKTIEIASNKIAAFLIFGDGLFMSAAFELAAKKGISVIFVTEKLDDFHFLEPNLKLGEKSLEVDLLLAEKLQHNGKDKTNKMNKVATKIISQYRNNILSVLQDFSRKKVSTQKWSVHINEKNNGYDLVEEVQSLEHEYFELLASYASVKTDAVKSRIRAFRQLLALEIIPTFIKQGISVSHNLISCSVKITYPMAYQAILDLYPYLIDTLTINLFEQKKIFSLDSTISYPSKDELATFSRSLEHVLQQEVKIPARKDPLTLRKLIQLQIRGIINALMNPFALYKPVPQEVLKSLKF